MSYQVPGTSPFVPCPRCGNPQVNPVKFTWWGGMAGPRLLKLAICPHCGLTYRGKTGASPTSGIVIYTVVLAAIAVLGFALFALL